MVILMLILPSTPDKIIYLSHCKIWSQYFGTVVSCTLLNVHAHMMYFEHTFSSAKKINIHEWDLSQISRVCSMNERFESDPMKGSHESRSTNSLGFVFILWCFYEYNSNKIVYFHLRYYQLFLYSKSRSSLITASKLFHITAPWHHSKHPLSCHNG